MSNTVAGEEIFVHNGNILNHSKTVNGILLPLLLPDNCRQMTICGYRQPLGAGIKYLIMFHHYTDKINIANVHFRNGNIFEKYISTEQNSPKF